MTFDLALIWARLPDIAAGAGVTLLTWAVGALAGLALGFAVAVLRRTAPLPLDLTLKAAVEAIRGTPFLIQLFLLYFGGPFVGLSLDPVPAGLIGLSVYAAAYFSEIFRGGFEAVPRGHVEAAECAGLSREQIVRRILIPEMTVLVLPAVVNMAILLIKETAVLSIITVPELTLVVSAIGSENYAFVEALFILALVYWAMVEATGAAGRWAERRVAKIRIRRMTTPALSVRNLSKSFGATEVLHGVNLEVAHGEVCCLIGPSGSGKSTLLRCMAFLEEASAGTILVNGQPLGFAEASGARRTRLPAQTIRAVRAQIGMVFQQFNLWPHMTALGNVSEALKTARKVPRAEAEARAMAQLQKVGLENRAGHYPSQLSGGQQQRVAIARALALEPKLMLFDEPTSSLDPELTGEVLNVMRRLADDGMTMVVVSHEIGFAATVGRRIGFLDHGRLTLTGTPQEVFGKPRDPRLQQFLDTYLDRGAAMLA